MDQGSAQQEQVIGADRSGCGSGTAPAPISPISKSFLRSEVPGRSLLQSGCEKTERQLDRSLMDGLPINVWTLSAKIRPNLASLVSTNIKEVVVTNAAWKYRQLRLRNVSSEIPGAAVNWHVGIRGTGNDCNR